jgi:hypothetical protein
VVNWPEYVRPFAAICPIPIPLVFPGAAERPHDSQRSPGAARVRRCPQVPQIAQALPQPVTAANVLDVEIGDAETVALIRYSGDSGEVTIRSRRQEQGGRPLIVAAEPAS